MRIAIMGAGAVGAYVGGYLARDGHDLVLGGWLESPTLVRLEPASGPAGTQVLLFGFGLPDFSAIRVTFDGIEATVIDARPDLGRAVVVVPPGLTAGNVEVLVEDLDSGRWGTHSDDVCVVCISQGSHA